MSTDLTAKRTVYWRALMDLLAERVMRDGWVRPEWDAMEKRMARDYWTKWREACEGRP